MNTVTLHLPDSLHNKLKELAERDGVSVVQFITTAITEKLSALTAAEYLRGRAARSSQGAFEQALQQVPDVEPAEYDRL